MARRGGDSWSGEAKATGLLVLVGVLVVIAIPLLVVATGAAVVVLVSAAAIACFWRVRVDIDRDGVHVRSPFGVPRVTIPLERIASADAIDVRPMRWGGWGYRGSLRLFRRAGWIVRAGPGLRLDLADNRVFAVTVDEAGAALAVLEGLRSTPR